MDFAAVLTISTSLFFIMDPFASLPVFLSITKGLPAATIRSYANKAVLVAGILMFAFVLAGPTLMNVFGVTMASFRVAGGIMLLLMAVEIVFSLSLSKPTGERGAAWVIVATPILTGPGVITQSILLSDTYGMTTVMLAGLIALAITWILLRGSSLIIKFVGEQAIDIFSRVIGLLIAAMGIEYIFEGTYAWFGIKDALIAIAQILV